MKLPKAILFDYGHTICYETGAFSLAGFEALMTHAIKNPHGLSPQQVYENERKWYARCVTQARTLGLEVANSAIWRAMFAVLELEFDCSLQELEAVYWDNACPPRPMPGIEKLLALLKEKGIKTGVVSNLTYCTKTLTDRIDRVLPSHDFSFIITSADFALRKPEPQFFQAALKMIGENAEDVWFCGDNTQADIFGAHGAGIFPVWFETDIPRAYRTAADEVEPDFEHLHIHHWDEMTKLFQGA
ncbi:MAG: HAD family hydrolase [Clostridia bacterium]|nr:HAD family hydrolase [Clostridia bacterium]